MSEPITNVEAAVRELGALPVPVGTETPMTPKVARVRLAQYAERTKSWSTATYDSGTERALHEIAVALLAEADALGKERDAFRDQRNHVFKTNERLIDQVRESEHARLLAENEARRVQREATALQARVDEVERAYTFDTAELKRRIAELEAERHSTNEALDDAVQELRARQTDEPTSVCRCDEPDVDPYACEAEDCTHEFSELNPFGASARPVNVASAEVSRTCGCGWRTSVWHVDDGSAEEELHGHVARVHGGVYPRSEAGDVR